MPACKSKNQSNKQLVLDLKPEKSSNSKNKFKKSGKSKNNLGC